MSEGIQGASSKPAAERDEIRVLYVGEDVLVGTWRALREYARRGCEGTVRWAGPAFQARDPFQVVTTIVVPSQRVGPGLFEIPHEATRAMGEALATDRLINLAQLHTHPSSSVRHSPLDDARAYSSRNGALSVVWPHHGELMAPIALWGVHECRARKWVWLSDEEAARRIVVLPSTLDLRLAIETQEDSCAEGNLPSGFDEISSGSSAGPGYSSRTPGPPQLGQG